MFLLPLAEANHFGIGMGLVGATLGAGIAALAAGYGISKIASASVESVARQPEVKGDVRGAMVLTAAMIEGAVFFAIVVCLLAALMSVGKIPTPGTEPAAPAAASSAR